ncbi:MAG: hypothetical protein K9W44_05270 [Candidatus Lokiarchaeota archaeon]|nr:hypothetical protein [Candidatus Harpocratesius repetitus]
MESSEKISSQKQTSLISHPFQNEGLSQELFDFFSNQPVSLSSSELIDSFNKFSSLPKHWSGRKLKQFLTGEGFLRYTRANPKGYYLNIKEIQETYLKESNLLLKESEKSTSEKIINSLANNPPETNKKTHRSHSFSSQESINDILDTIPDFPQYLLARMPKKARYAFRLGVAQINSLSISKLDHMIEYLTAAKMFFDTTYSNEGELVKAINDKIRYMSEISEMRHSESIQREFQKIFYSLYSKGKFSSIIQNWGVKYGLDGCAFRCWKKMGKKAKKIPISDYALRKMIAEVLKEKFPDKLKEK